MKDDAFIRIWVGFPGRLSFDSEGVFDGRDESRQCPEDVSAGVADRLHCIWQCPFFVESSMRARDDEPAVDLEEEVAKEAGLFARAHDFAGRILDLQREKELAEAFAFLAATTDDPKKIVAACVEEGKDSACLTVRLAINNGNLDHVLAGFGRMAKIFERFARTGELYVHRYHLQLQVETRKSKAASNKSTTPSYMRSYR